MIIDTHSHLQFNAFKEDSDQVIKKTLDQNIWMINVGTKYETSKKAVEISKQYQEGVYAAVGLHPMYAAAEFIKIKHDPNEEESLMIENYFDKEKYKKLALSDSRRVVAIGEVGLDYYYKPKTTAKLAQFKERQKQVFLEQLDLAKELNLPLILHCRVAHDDVIEILKERNANNGVVHCFTGTWEQAQKYMDMGFYLGLNGIIFKFHPVKSAEGSAPSGQFNGVNIDEVIKKAPLDRILVETDCPYLTPPQESNKRNEPIFIKHTIQKIADLKQISFQEVSDKTTENARALFKI